MNKKTKNFEGFQYSLCCFLLGLLVFGCATPESRIRKHQHIFDQYPLHIQERIRKGEVDIGFSRQMTFLALGKPARDYSRITEEGETKIWSYVEYDHAYQPQLVHARFHYRDSSGAIRHGTDSVWVDVQNKSEYEKLRIEFNNNKIIAIEKVNR